MRWWCWWWWNGLTLRIENGELNSGIKSRMVEASQLDVKWLCIRIPMFNYFSGWCQMQKQIKEIYSFRVLWLSRAHCSLKFHFICWYLLPNFLVCCRTILSSYISGLTSQVTMQNFKCFSRKWAWFTIAFHISTHLRIVCLEFCDEWSWERFISKKEKTVLRVLHFILFIIKERSERQ